MSSQVWRGSACEYQADEQEGVAGLSWRVSGTSFSSLLSCRGSREHPAARLPQDHHSCGGHRGDHSRCPHRCGTHRGGWLLCQGHEVPGISSGLFRGHRAETEHLGSSEGCTAGSHVGWELGDRLGQVFGEGMCLRTWGPGLGLEVGTSHLFPV